MEQLKQKVTITLPVSDDDLAYFVNIALFAPIAPYWLEDEVYVPNFGELIMRIDKAIRENVDYDLLKSEYTSEYDDNHNILEYQPEEYLTLFMFTRVYSFGVKITRNDDGQMFVVIEGELEGEDEEDEEE